MKIEIEIPDDELKETLTNVISKRLYDDYSCDRNLYKRTNADRIREMSDEGLANFLTGFSWLTEIGGKVCYKTIVYWLQQPAEETDNG